MLDATELEWASEKLTAMSDYFDGVVVGQERLRRALLATLLGKGHILVESVPGLAKTLAAATLARSVDASFGRVQCTPDLLPSDIVGTEVFDPGSATFHTELGPVHANFVLLDEINRSSAKTQSAMLEAMQERQTTIGGQSHPLPDPFVVMATQNPIEEEGTYVLPQAQMDRFLLKEIIDYPSADAEFEVLGRIERGIFDHPAPAVATVDDVARLRRATEQVHVDESIKRYIIELIGVTRQPADFLDSSHARWIEYGASPRGTIAFLQVARAHALLQGRGHVVPDDIVTMRHAILRHRIVLTFEALAEQIRVDDLIDAVFDVVPVP
ncbi:AAA family ATPase [Tessaracoccus massiliensis]|uniref:AAA family ATPase n=1 Tax=Tessaracoccus massiliensis TaxID=1522311 RepID=UPI000694E540|nr:AAA family ATPase [Tessaracoccus massiliensis]